MASGLASAEPRMLPRAADWPNGPEWSAVLWLGFLHVGALAAPFCFTWKAVLVAVVLSWLTLGIGICLGFHRLLTHGSFETYRPVRWVIALLGTLAGQGPPINWVASHRKHHRHSDQEDDPHSPRHGGWWSHMIWMMPRMGSGYWGRLYQRYARDLLSDPFMRLLEKTFLLWQLAVAVLLFAVGWFGWDLYTGTSFLVYGLFLRLLYVLHVTWAVNSATHMWGYQNYETGDNSRNLWWVGLLAYGEGWHNNHHAFQRSARHGHRWWEFDATYVVILVLEKVGLAWNVVRAKDGKVSAVSEHPAAKRVA